MFSNFIFILLFAFLYCFASGIYLQSENINNALSKQSNPNIKLTYAQVSLQVLFSTYKAMFLHNFPIIPQIPVICKACITSFLGSQCLCRFPPTVWETLSQLCSWWSICFRWLRIHLGVFTKKYSSPTSLPSDYNKCLSSLPPQPSVVCVQWTNSLYKWKDKFTITFLLFLPCSLTPAAHHFLVSTSLTWSHLHQPPCFIERI